MTTRRLVFLWSNFGPYHLDRLSSVRDHFGPETDVIGIELFLHTQTYGWDNVRDNSHNIVTLFPYYKSRSIWTRFFKLVRALPPAIKTHAFFCNYHQFDVFLAAVWFRLRGGHVFVMCDSKFDDYKRYWWREILKRLFMLPYHGGLSNSGRASDYLKFLGVPAERITGQYDTVRIDRIRKDAGVSPAPDGPAYLERHFIVVARLIPKKNHRMLLQAYDIYCRGARNPRKLVLCGSGPEETALKEQARELGIAEKVQFMGWLQSPEIARLLGYSIALLLPSIEEQFGLVVIEAQAMGLPVVLSDNCGARDNLVRNGVNGFLVEPDNPAGMAYFMTELGENEVLWRRMAKASAELSWKGDTSRFVEGVEELISEKKEIVRNDKCMTME